MNLTEKTLSQEYKYKGRIVNLRVDEVELPGGHTSVREVVEHPGGVCIAALTDRKELLFVRQYRYPLHGLLLELPAGKLDPGEDHRPAALRELSEETGLEAGELTYLGHIYASPGFCDEALHMYLARDLTRARQHLDEDEFLDVVTMPFDTLVEQVMSGEITDAKTVATVLKVKTLLGR